MKRIVRSLLLFLLLLAAVIAGGSLYMLSYSLTPDATMEAKNVGLTSPIRLVMTLNPLLFLFVFMLSPFQNFQVPAVQSRVSHKLRVCQGVLHVFRTLPHCRFQEHKYYLLLLRWQVCVK